MEVEIECPICNKQYQQVFSCQACGGIGVVRAFIRPLTMEEAQSSLFAQEGVSRLAFFHKLTTHFDPLAPPD